MTNLADHDFYRKVIQERNQTGKSTEECFHLVARNIVNQHRGDEWVDGMLITPLTVKAAFLRYKEVIRVETNRSRQANRKAEREWKERAKAERIQREEAAAALRGEDDAIAIQDPNNHTQYTLVSRAEAEALLRGDGT